MNSSLHTISILLWILLPAVVACLFKIKGIVAGAIEQCYGTTPDFEGNAQPRASSSQTGMTEDKLCFYSST
jgi:hypothetical protein